MDYPKLRNIEIFPVQMSGQQVFCFRDPYQFTEKMLFVPPDMLDIISLFDGRHSILDIQTKYTRRYGTLLFSDRVRQIIEEMDTHLFLETERFNEARRKIEDEFRNSDIRRATHVGGAYASESEALQEQLKGFFSALEGSEAWEGDGPIQGAVAPHIDLQRGGPNFAYVYREIAKSPDPDLFVVLGTCHGEMKNPFAVTAKGFETPLGVLETDEAFVRSLADRCGFDPFEDELAHRVEHSVEFQAVFLQYTLRDRARIQMVPVLCGSFQLMISEGKLPMENPEIRSFVEALQETIASSGRRVCLIASADLSHIGARFGDREPLTPGSLKMAEAADLAMLGYVEKGDGEGFFWSVQRDQDRRRICGLSSIYVLLSVLKPEEGKLLKYTQSVDQNTGSMVSFAGVVFG